MKQSKTDTRLIHEQASDHQRLTNIVRMGFAAVLVLGVILVTMTIHRLSEFNESMTKIVDVHNKKMELAFAMRDAIRRRAVSIYSMLATDDYFERDAELLHFYSYAGEYKNLLRELLSLGMDTREREIHKRLAESANQAQPINRHTAEMLMSGGSGEDVYESVKVGLLAQKKLLDILDELILVQKEYSEDAVVTNREVYRLTWLFLMVVGVGVLLIGALIARTVIQHVRERSQELSMKNIELAHAYERAEEATNAKSIFLANMSHEIRTPMNGVLGMLDVIRGSTLTEEQRQYVNTAYHSSEALLTVINDILDLSKVEAGKLRLEKITFNLWRLAEEVVSLYAKEAQDKGVELVCHIHSGVPQMVNSDPTRIRQILNNLISNAIKFTKKGEVILQVSYAPANTGRARFRFEVQDTGMGIPPQEQATIFETFNQGKQATSRKFGGTGLGLTISKQLAEMLGGSIGVTSVEGKGSTFWATGEFELADASATNDEGVDMGFYTQAVLCVDHEKVHRVLQEYLQGMGMKILVPATDGVGLHDALAALVSQQEPMLVFCDAGVLSEGMSAISSKALGQVFQDHGTKVIAIGKYNESAKTFEERLGIDDVYFITKPIRYFALARALSTVGRQSTFEDGKLQANGPGTPQSNGWILLVEDNVVNQKVACALIKGFGYDVVVAENGKEGLELMKEGGFDLVFMDCQMPIMDGFEATKRIRQYEQEYKLPRIPIVAMTANTLEGGKEDCLAAGMDDYFAKPLHRGALDKVLKTWIGGKARRAQEETGKAAGTVKAEDNSSDSVFDGVTHLSMNTLNELRETFSPLELREVFVVFIRHAREKLSQLKQAIGTGDMQGARDIIHSLKGSSGNVGAEHLYSMTTKLMGELSSGGDGVLTTAVVAGLEGEVDILERLFQELKYKPLQDCPS